MSKNIINKIVFSIIVIILAICPLFLSDFRMNMLGQFISYAVVAIGLDLIWGYTGILSLGHGVFFGLGAYCMAMYLKLESSDGKLPDFMSWSGIDKIPLFWKPFNSPIFAFIMVVLTPILLALILGYFTFKNRIRGVYFSILSQALSIIFVTLFIGQQAYTGGTNGITNFNKIFGHSLFSHSTKLTLYYISLFVLIITYITCSMLVNGRVGRVLIAIRDSENRLRFSGYNPTTFKVFVYCVSAGLAGIAGALFVTQVGIISPAQMAIVPSIEMIIWVAVGGRGTLIGAVIGALLMNITKTYVSEQFPDIWSYFLGLVFMVVVVFMPYGLVGSIKKTGSFLKSLIKKGERGVLVE